MVTDEQVRKLMEKIREGETMVVASLKAGMDEKTARKYRRMKRLPSQCKQAHTWRTWADRFESEWEEIEQILRRDEGVEAKTIFEYLCRKYEGRFKEGQLRTLQRKIKRWRIRHGRGKEVMFEQVHLPSRQSQSDFTHMKSLGVTIQGILFDHLFFHFVLPYSNWETGGICFSQEF